MRDTCGVRLSRCFFHRLLPLDVADIELAELNSQLLIATIIQYADRERGIPIDIVDKSVRTTREYYVKIG